MISTPSEKSHLCRARRVGRILLLAFLGVVAVIFIGPMIFASILVGKVSNELAAQAERDTILQVSPAGPNAVALRLSQGPTPAQKAAATPALLWPIEQLSGLTATHYLVQQTSRVREDRWAFGMPSSAAPLPD